MTNPGRTQGRRGKWEKDRIPAQRVAWAEFFSGKIAVNQYVEVRDTSVPTEEQEALPELGMSVSLLISSQFEHRNIKLIPTNLTGDELDALEKVLLHAIALARPTVELRDKLAEEALKNGDDSNERIYRGVPTFVVRPGKS